MSDGRDGTASAALSRRSMLLGGTAATIGVGTMIMSAPRLASAAEAFEITRTDDEWRRRVSPEQ